MTDTEFDQCVAGFYRAASGQVEWGEALRALHEAFSLWAIHIFGLDMASGTITFSFEVGGARPEAAIDFARTWDRHDPRTRLALQPEEGQWMNCREHVDDAFVAGDPFYQEFLTPYGGRWVSGMKLVEDGAFVSLLAMMRGPHQIPFSKPEDALAHRLAHHLSLALKLYRTNSRLANQASNRLALLGKIETPLLLIDEQRRIHSRTRRREASWTRPKRWSSEGTNCFAGARRRIPICCLKPSSQVSNGPKSQEQVSGERSWPVDRDHTQPDQVDLCKDGYVAAVGSGQSARNPAG